MTARPVLDRNPTFGRTAVPNQTGLRGAGGTRGGADAFPKTVALLESLMKAKGIPVEAVQASAK